MMNPQVDDYFDRIEQWKKELTALRHIALDCGLTEEYKWKQPCYSYKGDNIAIIGGFKDSFVCSFFKGVLLQDEGKVLVSPGANSHHVRMFRFTDLAEINAQEDLVKAYIYEAIEIEEAGLKVEKKEKDEPEIPAELQEAFDEDSAFQAAFEALTPGRQRFYHIHFGSAKQSKTRIARIMKYKSRILSGFGFNDCVCGQSKKMPNCDGSHKYL